MVVDYPVFYAGEIPNLSTVLCQPGSRCLFLWTSSDLAVPYLGSLFANAEAGEYFAQQFVAAHRSGYLSQTILALAQVFCQ